MSKAWPSSGLEGQFLYFSPWKHQDGHIPDLTSLKSSQVCSQWRSLKGATAPDMFTTLRLSPVLITSPLPSGQRSPKMLLQSSQHAWCALSTHHHICELSAIVAPCWVKTLQQVLGGLLPASLLPASYRGNKRAPIFAANQAMKRTKEIFWLQLEPCDGQQSILKDFECKLRLWSKWTHSLFFSVTQQWTVLPNICLMAVLLANTNSNTAVAVVCARARSISEACAVPVLTVLARCENDPTAKGRRRSAKWRVNYFSAVQEAGRVAQNHTFALCLSSLKYWWQHRHCSKGQH